MHISLEMKHYLVKANWNSALRRELRKFNRQVKHISIYLSIYQYNLIYRRNELPVKSTFKHNKNK